MYNTNTKCYDFYFVTHCLRMYFCSKFDAFIRNLTVLWSIPFMEKIFHSEINASWENENSKQFTKKKLKNVNWMRKSRKLKKKKKIINMQRSLFINVNDVFCIQILAVLDVLVYSNFLLPLESIKNKNEIHFVSLLSEHFYICVPFHGEILLSSVLYCNGNFIKN